MTSAIQAIYARQRRDRLRKLGVCIRGGEAHGPSLRADLCASCWAMERSRHRRSRPQQTT